MQHLTKKNRTVLILILGLLSAIGPFSIDMYLPGFPAIANSLHSTVDVVAYSLSSFFIGVCAGQLLCGPLLDRFGRKRPLVVGLVVYVIASVGCSFAASVEVLIAFRFVQALGGSVGMIAPGAIVRDVFPLDENAKIFSLLILILGVSPILAPTVGSYIIAHFGWSWVFIVLATVAALILAIVLVWLHESKPPDPDFSLLPGPILKGFAQVFRQAQFTTYAFAGAVAASGLFAYLAGSPYIFMQMYGVSEQQYGWIFASIAAGLIGCSQLNTFILKRYSSAQVIRVVMVAQSIFGLALVVGSLTGITGLFSTIVLIFLFLSCQGFTFPNAAALAMAPFDKGAGSASAIMGALQMACGAVASALVGLFFNKTAVPMTAIMALCSAGGLVILLFGQRRINAGASDAQLQEASFEMIEKC